MSMLGMLAPAGLLGIVVSAGFMADADWRGLFSKGTAKDLAVDAMVIGLTMGGLSLVFG